MTSFMDELERAIRSLRQTHELEAHQIQRLEDFATANQADLMNRLRSFRDREARGRSELFREVLLIASEMGRLPSLTSVGVAPSAPAVPAPEQPAVHFQPDPADDPMDFPRIVLRPEARRASENLAQALN